MSNVAYSEAGVIEGQRQQAALQARPAQAQVPYHNNAGQVVYQQIPAATLDKMVPEALYAKAALGHSGLSREAVAGAILDAMKKSSPGGVNGFNIEKFANAMQRAPQQQQLSFLHDFADAAEKSGLKNRVAHAQQPHAPQPGSIDFSKIRAHENAQAAHSYAHKGHTM